MMAVSGVGENKFQKYGQRFIDAVTAFSASHPLSSTASKLEEEDGSNPLQSRKRTGRKELFYIRPEDAKRFVFADYYTISEIRDGLNQITTAENVKKAATTVIWDYLAEEGLVTEEEQEGRFVKFPTEQGWKRGIKTVDKVSQRGTAYQILMYPRDVQKMIVEYFIGSRGVSSDEAADMDGQANARAAWSKEEDERLADEFKAGMKMSEIAKKHGRTNGAIRARLQKYGLVK